MSFSDTPHAPPEGIDDDFLDQLFSGPPSTAGVGAGGFILDERRAVFAISEEAALSMSRLSGASASAVAELVPVIPLQWIQAMQFLKRIYLAAATFHSESMLPKPDAPS